jgi:peptide/nickel transport system ATP-binding protein
MLNVNNLSIAFGQKEVLKNLSFSLRKGESIGIVGESGSGKSITALSLMGLLPSSAKILTGSAIIEVDDKTSVDLIRQNYKDHAKIRGSRIAMIFQEPMTSLNPSMRCGRQVEEALSIHQNLTGRALKEKCLSLFTEMQLPNPSKAYRSYPHELSGGQKQRVMIAMALAGNPQVLIADEPTTALDVTVQKEILSLLKDIIISRGMSLIFISHDLGVISEITQSLLVLKDGELVESGNTSKLLSNPIHPYTQGLIACRPPLNSRPERLMTINEFVGSSKDSLPPSPIDKETFTLKNNQIYSEKPILSVKGVDVEYVLQRNLIGTATKVFTAVKNMHLDLYLGETLGLVGESGCGKTTLGRSILGLVEYNKGEIYYKGKEIKSFSKKEMQLFRQEVQLVFQDPYSSLNPRHTIGQAIMEPLEVHQLVSGKTNRKNKALELIQQVSLPIDSFFRYPHEFSGGQRQRVAIARALAMSPKVIVCDEMVSALDVSVQAHILNLLNDLKREFGLTYIFISHDLSVVKYMSNRMLVMKNGQAIELGISDEVYENPQSDYTKQLINAIPKGSF